MARNNSELAGPDIDPMMRGYTLIELVVAVAIVGILATLALPSYQRYNLKTNRSSGSSCLIEAQRRVESVYQHTYAYPADLTGAGYATASSSCGDQALYQVSLSLPNTTACPSANCYQLIATPQGSQVKDGSLRLTYDASQTDPNVRYVREHLPPSASTWVTSWDFQPGQ